MAYFQQCFKIKAHDLNIEAISTDNPHKMLITCSRDQTIKLWGSSDHLIKENIIFQRASLSHHQSTVISVKSVPEFYKPSFFLSLSNDETVKVWDFSQKKCIKTMKLTGSVSSFLIYKNKIYAAFGRDNLYIIKALSIFDGSVIQEYKAHRDVISSLMISESLQILISAGRDKMIVIWNVKTSKNFIKPLKIHDKIHKQGITSMILIDEKQVLITGSNDKSIKIWLIAEKGLKLDLIRILNLHKGWILSLCHVSNDMIVSSASDDEIRVWNIKTGECLQLLKDEMFSPGSLLFIKEKGILLAGDKNGDLRIWKTSELLK